MSRIIRMGVGAAKACLQAAGLEKPDAIVTGTAYGCLADTGVFLAKMIEQREEMLPPTAFIQSTHNTVGGQIALMLQCHGYNNTFVHRGHSFESALLDGMLLLQEGEDGDSQAPPNEITNVLVGGMDEITEISHAILSRFGLYRNTRAGEGATFFLLSSLPTLEKWAKLEGLETFYKPKDADEVEDRVRSFLRSRSIGTKDIDLVIMGNNGDPAGDAVYEQLASSVLSGCPVRRYKDRCGEYPTSPSFALWLAADFVRQGQAKRALIYNHYLGYHSLILVAGCR